MSAAVRLLCCPRDRAPLERDPGGGLRCGEGHRFEDRGGIIDLAPPPPRFRFDRWAPVYDLLLPWVILPRVFGVRRGVLEGLHARAMGAAGRGGVVLDVACGSGLLSLPAARAAGVRVLVGVDLSRPMLEAARRRADRLGVAAVLGRGDAGDVAVAEGAADAAIMSLGLQFVEDRGRCLAGIRRALREGGRFFGAAPALGLSERYDRRHARRKRKDFPVDRVTLAEELGAAGFGEVRVETRGALVLWEAVAGRGVAG